MTRRRWVYTEGGKPLPQPYEVGEDFQNSPGRAAPYTDSYMDGARATDGTDIGSRAKRRAYMKAHNLADADDFKGTWAQTEKQRADFYTGKWGKEERREALARALHQHETRRK